MKVSIINKQITLDLLDDIVLTGNTALFNSLTFNTNGYDIELPGDFVIGFVDGASDTDIVMNCKGSTIFRSGTQTRNNAALQAQCSRFTLNDCTIIEYNSFGGCTGVGLYVANMIANINNCTMRVSGYNRS